MKIILLVGPGEVSKRNELLKIKRQYPPENISQIDLKTQDASVLEVGLASSGLFETGAKLVIGENVPDKLDLKKINLGTGETTLVMVADSPKATSKLLESAKALKAQVLSFEGEKETSMFPFLDKLIEQKKEALIELEKYREEWGSMYVITMVYYLLRRNILPLPQSAYAAGKIKEQKKKYSLQNFTKLYYLAIQAEYNIKNGDMDEKGALTRLAYSFISHKSN
ncbi:hypothetical protein A2617_00465 [Candidatus Daviesbacteria bacterium RIFOXYD1_FULL_41_10]|uniref:DNA polymerase III delta N-terminal domain-containing protein n=2 Tax=Candidatus Daviesiibacteriota TaxID=1752718 RepID=A0A1F5N062_9BACT|nr:MAG: hypothetical protein UU67_C0007G0014 [Candidatus Daviesbacteria bacterium GW2011_GWB1_41_5]OGE71008.1 MAG: hypothetical protein A2617_00465 [Candidatus Daviesbacteria bacterium RIFOXYD1_FULL_41_10]